MERAKLSREHQVMIGHPSEHEYKDMVSNKLLYNFHFTIKDITNAKSIFGPNLLGVRVKSVKHNPISMDAE